MTLKWLRVNTTKTTNELEKKNLIGLAKGGKRARLLFGLANTQSKVNTIQYYNIYYRPI